MSRYPSLPAALCGIEESNGTTSASGSDLSVIGESGDKHLRLLSSENPVVSAKLELYTLYKTSGPILLPFM